MQLPSSPKLNSRPQSSYRAWIRNILASGFLSLAALTGVGCGAGDLALNNSQNSDQLKVGSSKEAVPGSECITLTRQQLVNRIYDFKGSKDCEGDDRPKISCQDVTDAVDSCKWTVAKSVLPTYSEDSCGPNDPVTRAEMMRVITKLTNIDTAAFSGFQAQFSDTENHWAGGDITAAVLYKILASAGGEFNPDDVAITCWADDVLTRAKDFLPRITELGQPYRGSTDLPSKSVNAYGFEWCSPKHTDTGFSRLTFSVSPTGLTNEFDDIYNFSFREVESDTLPGVNIWGVNQALKANLKNASLGQGLSKLNELANNRVADGTYFIIVSLDNGLTIPSGKCAKLLLKIDINEPTTNDTLSVRLLAPDEDAKNKPCRKIYSTSEPSLFSSADGFSKEHNPLRNLIWTNYWANPHQDPNVVNGNVADNTGSCDVWTGEMVRQQILRMGSWDRKK